MSKIITKEVEVKIDGYILMDIEVSDSFDETKDCLDKYVYEHEIDEKIEEAMAGNLLKVKYEVH